MAMVGPLALRTDDDQEDSDFFDQLANEFGDEDLGHLQSGLQQEEKDKLDDAFSKLILGEEDCASAPIPIPTPAATSTSTDAPAVTSTSTDAPAVTSTSTDAPASFSIAADIGDNYSVGHGSWLKEDSVEETAIENESTIPADEVLTTCGHPPSLMDEPLGATDALHSSAETKSSIENLPSDILTLESVTGHGLELSGSQTSESGTAEPDANFPSGVLPQEIPELDSSPTVDNESRQGLHSTPVDNGSDFSVDGIPNVANDGLPFEASIVNSIATSSDFTFVESGDVHALPNVDPVGAAGSPSIQELQWSSFGNSYVPDAFGSYSDFFSELASETLVGSSQEAISQIGGYQGEPLTDAFPTALNAQGSLGAGGESFVFQDGSFFNGVAAEHFDERSFWNQQGAFNFPVTEQDNVVASLSEVHHSIESNQSGISTASVSGAGGAQDMISATNYEAQPQEELQQSWEKMYPGWYFDYASNEWKQIEGWSAGQEQHLPREDENPFSSQPSESSQSVSMASNSFWQSNQGQELWPAVGSDQSIAAGTHAPTDEQQFTTTSSLPEQQTNWDQQYPGWYYDYQTQQWCQIADYGESWASNEDPKPEESQVVESVQNLQPSGGGWIGEELQPHYQSEVNQSVYSSERSHSLYASGGGGDTSMLTRGASFNSWADPATRDSLLGQQGMDNTQKGSNVSSWTGFQSVDRTVPNPTYHAVHDPFNQSQQDFILADKPSFLDSSQGFFQLHNPSTGGVGGERSSAGRPSHALVTFGFGGKLVTMKAPRLRDAEPLVLHDLNHLVSSAECQSDAPTYFSALNRQGLSGPLPGATSKEVLKWVDEQIEKCGKEDSQRMNSVGVRVLWGVLKIACQHYGKLRSMAGSAGIKSQMEDGPEVALGRLLASAKSHGHWNQGLATSTDVLHSIPSGHQLQAAVNEVRNQLMDGKIKEALQFAQQGQLWGLALVLAWQLGEKVYADTILQMAQQQFSPGSPMRTLLLLFAGQASELFRVQSLPASGTYGPFSPATSNAQDSAGGMLTDWLGNLSIIAANPSKGDEQVIIHLGDSLWKDQGEVAGAHTCYLVADATFESFSKEARLCLVGADHFKFQRTFATPQAIQRTELYEYAKTLGNSQYVLVPFQPFKLLYAHMLAEAGRTTEASRYCQVVIKNLKSAGRGSDLEFCKQSAITLEERLRLHSQGGYSLNFSTGKLVGKVMGTIDSTIHKIIGGPPLPQQPTPAVGNSPDWYTNGGTTGLITKTTPMVPSASNNNLFIVNNQVDVPSRSVSEPNLIRSSTEEHNAATGPETSSVSPSQFKSVSSSGGGYLGRFGSQIFAKAMGLMRHNKEAKLGDENKFYYDEKLKRWVEAGAEQSTEEAILAPPPIVASFNSSYGSPSDANSGGEARAQSAGVSSSPDLPPIPPSVNQFSARGRLHGVRSRYVDTFNKGNVQAATKPPQLPTVPAGGGGWGVGSSPSQFFTSASSTAATNGNSDVLANGHNNGEFLKPDIKGGFLQVENEPLLPKNLNTSFMDVPLIQKHSSTGNMAMLTGNDYTPVKNDAPSLGNMPRAVSWSGGSPNTIHQRNLSNGSIADIQTMNSTLPSPPILEPPPSYAGYESGQMQAVPAKGMISGSFQGAAFGEMQEVEL